MGYKWDRESVTDRIARLADRGKSTRSGDVMRDHPNLYYAARYHFGSYAEALRIAVCGAPGTDSSSADDPWPRARVCDRIRECYQTGGDVSYTAMRGKALLRHAKRHFGSWQAAVEATGIDYVEVKRYGWGAARALLNGSSRSEE